VTASATAERPPHCAFQHLDVGVGVGLPILGASSGQLAARVMPEQGLMGYHHIISRLVFDPRGSCLYSCGLWLNTRLHWVVAIFGGQT